MQFYTILLRSAASLALIVLTGIAVKAMLIPLEIPAAQNNGSALTTVEVCPIQKHETGIDFAIDGEVIPFRRIDLVAEIAGRVTFKSEQCRLGRYVDKDELLMKIDPVEYQLAVDQAAAAVKQAKVNVDENEVQKTNTESELQFAKQQLEISKLDYDRYEKLREQNTVAPGELEKARSTLLTSEESVKRLENQLRVLDTQTEKLNVLLKKEEYAQQNAELNLARTEVKAPIAGVITADSFEVNSFIQKGANVAKILDTSQLEIQCSLYMRQIQWIWKQSGDTAENAGYVFTPTPVSILYESDGEGWVWKGVLQTLDGGVMNSATRMVPCRVRVEDPQSGKRLEKTLAGPPIEIEDGSPTLFAGMYVRVVVHSKPSIPLYRIPERALLPGNRIWTVVDGKLRQHQIRIATTTPEGVLFYADAKSIHPNELVVISPLATPSEGSPVQVAAQIKPGGVSPPLL